MRWPSPWGWGFPGWHIECSAISSTLLGQPFDIHAGGIDHIPVHHTNEIAQSEGAYNKPLANYWVHGEFLIVKAKRMGKSAGNFITLAEVKKRGFHPLSYRYFVLGAHYRSPLNFTWEALRGAQNALYNLYNAFGQIQKNQKNENLKALAGSITKKETAIMFKKFKEALNDDLNTPRALAVVWEVVKNTKLSAKQKATLLARFDKVLGLDLKKFAAQLLPQKIPVKIRKLAEKRELYRKNKQFIQADALRKKLKQLGYEIDDTPRGPLIRKI